MFTTHTAPRRRRRLALLSLVGVAAVAVSGCASSAGGTESETGEPSSISIGAVIKGLDNPFFQYMEQGIEETAEEAGVSVTVQAAESENDTTGQADRLDTLLGQSLDCYIVNPITNTNLVQSLSAANGKPIVNIDTQIEAETAEAAGAEISTYIGTNSEDAGRAAGEFVVEQVPAGSEVAVIGGTAGNEASRGRTGGFKEAIGDDYVIVQESAADWQRELALTTATDIIAAHPEIKAFFAANDEMGLGILRAAENAGLADQITIVSVDGNPDALDSVAAGGLSATVSQYPYAIGQLAVQACQVAAGGGELPELIESPIALVTVENAQEAIDAFPRPFTEFENPLEGMLADQ